MFQFLRDPAQTSGAAQAVRRALGSEWRVADWNDIRNTWSGNRSQWMRAFEGRGAHVTWNGDWQWQSSGRVFFVEDFNGSKPGNFLAHDQLGGNEITLGSWFGENWPILAFRPPPTPTPTNTPTPTTSGGRIAFTSQRDGNNEIYTMNADGSGLTRLTNNSAGDSHPDWSPDGRKIAFASRRGGGNNDIYIMNADGSGVERITTDNYSGSPSWSPDGRRIAFVSRRSGAWEIYVMDADGSNVARVTNNSMDEGKPSWSRDGRRLTFDAYPQGRVYVVNVDGTNFQSVRSGWNPAFSPANNSLIAFGVGGLGGIHVMNDDGSNVTRLTSHGGGAAWSSDGRRISFTSRGGAANEDIYAVDADGSDVTRLTSHSAKDEYSSWGP